MDYTRTIDLGGQTVTIERPSGRKASRALALIRALTKAAPGIQRQYAQFVRDYERENVVELDRAQARLRYPPRVIIDDAGQPVLDERTGEPMLAPSPVDRMSEADWEASGGRLKLPNSPSVAEGVAAVLDVALETAEDHVYRLLALFTIPNGELKALWRGGSLGDELTRRADDLLDDVYADELLELAVVCGEVVDTAFRTKATDLGDRLGNALRLIGLPTTKTTTSASTSADAPSSSTPPSSTDAEPPTDGAPTTPSTPPSTSSSSSPDSPSSTPPPERNAN